MFRDANSVSTFLGCCFVPLRIVNYQLPLRSTEKYFVVPLQLEFQDTMDKSDPDVKRLTTPETMQSVPCEVLHNPQAIHKVSHN